MGNRRTRTPPNDALSAAALADQARLARVKPLLPEFLEHILQVSWVAVSPATRLSDFTSLAPLDTLHTRIREHYRLPPTTPIPDVLVQALELIQTHRG